MAFTNPVDTLTLEWIVPQVIDTVLRSNTFLTKMLSKTKRFKAATQDFPKTYLWGSKIESNIRRNSQPLRVDNADQAHCNYYRNMIRWMYGQPNTIVYRWIF